MNKTLLSAAAALLLSACASGPQVPTGLQIDRTYSAVGQDSRSQFLVLHYTALNWERSLQVLSTQQVSAHYLVRDEPPSIYQLVDENRRAWHAGISSWAGHTQLNSASIGIEIVNAGFTDSPKGRVYVPYPPAQIDNVIALVKDIVARHNIRPERIVGHSDIAPGRKQDPGPLFPWRRLADAGVIPWPDAAQISAKLPLYESLPPDAAWFQDKLSRVGYKVERSGSFDAATIAALSTLQTKYRPSDYSGFGDAETAALLDVLTSPNGMWMIKPGPEGRPEPYAQPYTARW
ncbi:N-acetylmuramoyl-L-alanine amidase [Paucibacter sp. AS339]|uniref:N-acetylmuramoyl-L-alanine amidase n=1 Tax=Paucibacter hankyongi TaxID=3133434 RepID=UPI0030ADA9A1